MTLRSSFFLNCFRLLVAAVVHFCLHSLSCLTLFLLPVSPSYLYVVFIFLYFLLVSTFSFAPLSSSPHSLPLTLYILSVIFVSFFLSPLPSLSLSLSSSSPSLVSFPRCVLMQNGMFYTSYVSTYPCLVNQVSPKLLNVTSVMCFQTSLLLSFSSCVTSFFLGDACFVQITSSPLCRALY